jgi:hypothetical protein
MCIASTLGIGKVQHMASMWLVGRWQQCDEQDDAIFLRRQQRVGRNHERHGLGRGLGIEAQVFATDQQRARWTLLVELAGELVQRLVADAEA